MPAKTKIEWTDCTWSPLRARVKADAAQIATSKGYGSMVQIAGKMAGHVGPHCERVSHGCDHCYSDTNNGRCLPANGTGLPFDRRSRDLVEPFVDEKILLQPLKWRTSQRIFVENQSDLFGEWNTDEMIDRVFAVMALCPQHTFQILTKRPERMLAYCNRRAGLAAEQRSNECPSLHSAFPDSLPNLWLGVSVEDPDTANKRIPDLLQTPAAKRFVSYEPAIESVDFTHYLTKTCRKWSPAWNPSACDGENCPGRALDWIIVGGESGSGARPFDISWARQTLRQCRAAGVALFVKQLGAKPMLPGHRQAHYDWGPGIGLPESATRFTAVEPHRESSGMWRIHLKDRKGGDISEWPEDLRVREFPNRGAV